MNKSLTVTLSFLLCCRRTYSGITPLHVTCLNGNTSLLTKLIAAGGDLRLHDHFGRTARDWAGDNADPKRGLKIVEFLDMSLMIAVNTSSGEQIGDLYVLENMKLVTYTYS